MQYHSHVLQEWGGEGGSKENRTVKKLKHCYFTPASYKSY